jgi:hypothetical protein
MGHTISTFFSIICVPCSVQNHKVVVLYYLKYIPQGKGGKEDSAIQTHLHA